jgi:hypothetical protein
MKRHCVSALDEVFSRVQVRLELLSALSRRGKPRRDRYTEVIQIVKVVILLPCVLLSGTPSVARNSFHQFRNEDILSLDEVDSFVVLHLPLDELDEGKARLGLRSRLGFVEGECEEA